MEHYAVLPDGMQVPALGQGTWPLRFVTEERLQFPEAGKRNIPWIMQGQTGLCCRRKNRGGLIRNFRHRCTRFI